MKLQLALEASPATRQVGPLVIDRQPRHRRRQRRSSPAKVDAGHCAQPVRLEQADRRLREVLTRVARGKGFEPCELLAEYL